MHNINQYKAKQFEQNTYFRKKKERAIRLSDSEVSKGLPSENILLIRFIKIF